MKKKKIIGIIGPGSHFIKKIHPVIRGNVLIEKLEKLVNGQEV